MSRLLTPRLALAGMVALGLAAYAVMTISPASHDFGQVTVKARGQTSFRISAPKSAWTPSSLITLSFTGPDAADFFLEQAPTQILTPGQFGPRPLVRTTAINPVAYPCVGNSVAQTVECDQIVLFVPSSLGPKSATLVATGMGTPVTAQLKGEGIFGCLMKVVPCNYAHLYSGIFGWTLSLNAPNSRYSENVQVNVIDGVATCNGAATDIDQGQSKTGAITGNGLIAVEFDPDTTGKKLEYTITAACPTPDWPATSDAAAMPSRPAELGHNFQTSYRQPASALGINLVGSSSYPAPETDPINRVSGVVSVSWDLKRP